MLSIVIPTLNEEKSLPRLLEQIYNQTGIEFEVIVADNFSKDKTRRIAESFGARVVDGGLPAKARNCGEAVAKGEVILFLDADVLLPAPDFLLKSVVEFTEKGLGIATCSIVPLSKKSIDKFFHHAYNLYVRLLQHVDACAPGFCIFVLKKVHVEIGGFDDTIFFEEDHDYSLRAAKISHFGVLKSYPILCSVRRFERDGRLTVVAKNILCRIYMLFKGPVRSDIFHYKWGYKK